MEKAELLQAIERSWASLDDLVAGLREPELTRHGPDGWSVKDHLAHLAAWNLALVALLEGRDRAVLERHAQTIGDAIKKHVGA